MPLEDSLGEIAKLQQEGKIRHVGVSNFDADELARARKVVEVVSVQNRYNVSDRSSDAVLAACERDGIAFIPWSPLSQSPRDSNAGARATLEAWAAAARRLVPAGGDRLAAGALAGDAADSRHVQGRSTSRRTSRPRRLRIASEEMRAIG